MNYKIGILNIGVNNLKSLNSFFTKFGNTVFIDNKNINTEFKNIDLLILPGNGNFAFGSDYLTKNNMIYDIKNFNKKIIGICLGMQLFFENSEESYEHRGLSLIKGSVKKINLKNVKLPLLGWYTSVDENNIKRNYFFNNSYSCKPKNNDVVVQKIITDFDEIVSVVKYKNVYGMQFHPEKSSVNGYNLIKKIINE